MENHRDGRLGACRNDSDLWLAIVQASTERLAEGNHLPFTLFMYFNTVQYIYLCEK